MNIPSKKRQPCGFTVVEAVAAVALLGVTLTASVASLTYVMRNERYVAAQGELDMDASLLVERLRRDLWRTSREMILVHPPGDGPYQAISFPVVRGNEPVVQNEDGEIEWAATVIYHLKAGTPSEVRRTVFEPRIEMTEAERETQLANVVRDGNGESTYNSDNALTRVLIENPVEWELNITGTRFDAYSPSPGRRTLRMGTAMLEDAQNEFTFRVAGKNTATEDSSRFLGMDSLSVFASGLPMEGEWQTVSHSSGATPAVQNMGAGETWSGNSRLWFEGGQDNDSFTVKMENDRWEERNFLSVGATFEDISRVFIQPDDRPHTFALRLDGNGMVWLATNQARTVYDSYNTAPTSLAVRVFLRGSDLWEDFDGGWIGFNGTNVWARFAGGMHIENAFIAQSALVADLHNPSMDYLSGTRADFRFGGSASRDVWVPLSSAVESDKLEYAIEKTNSYIVGIHLTPHRGFGAWWSNAIPMRLHTSATAGMTNCFVVSNATADEVAAVQWSELPDKLYVITNEVVETNGTEVTTNLVETTQSVAAVSSTNAIFALAALRAGHAPKGVYTSQIIDTQLADPDYLTLQWVASQPSNAVMEVKVRAGASADLSDASPWSEVPLAESGAAPVINGRFAQVQVAMAPGIDALTTPEVQDFTLRWSGGRRYADLSGIFSTGPDHGVYELLVNGAPLLQGVTVQVSVFKEIRLAFGTTTRMESSAFAEIVPRN